MVEDFQDEGVEVDMAVLDRRSCYMDRGVLGVAGLCRQAQMENEKI
jgi:hypothetical protein